MADLVDALSILAHKRLRTLVRNAPSLPVLKALVRVAYSTTLKPEESRFVKGALTLADPRNTDPDAPPLRRADYPSFTALKKKRAFTTENVAKLARAVDLWSGAIAVYGDKANNLTIWGIADQLVQTNMRLNREATSGFSHPGIVFVTMDGIGEVSVYHRDILLASIRAQRLTSKETEPLKSLPIIAKIAPALQPVAAAIGSTLKATDRTSETLHTLLRVWAQSICRLCIGIRRQGTGGALVLTPAFNKKCVSVSHPFAYERLTQAMMLSVLDSEYAELLQEYLVGRNDAESVARSLVIEALFAETDKEDRLRELTSATKLVASLASLDGVVLLSPELSVVGFGVKLNATRQVRSVTDGAAYEAGRLAKVDISRLGTRHGSILRYCAADRAAIGIVVSQDGGVSVVTSLGSRLLMWQDVKLLGHETYSPEFAARLGRRRAAIASLRRGRPQQFGYARTPKTLKALLSKRS